MYIYIYIHNIFIYKCKCKCVYIYIHIHSYSFLKSQLVGVQFPCLYCNTPKTNQIPAPPSVSQPVQIPETTDMFMVKSTSLVGLTWFKPQFGAVNPLHIDYFLHKLTRNLHFYWGFPSHENPKRFSVTARQVSSLSKSLETWKSWIAPRCLWSRRHGAGNGKPPG